MSVLRVSGGGTTRDIVLPTILGDGASDVAIWKNTALVGNLLVNLVTGDVLPAGTYDPAADPDTLVPGSPACRNGLSVALADGVLAVDDVCAGTIVTFTVSVGGVLAADLAGTAANVAAPDDGLTGRLALSRGLLVWAASGPEVEGDVARWTRLGSGLVQETSLPGRGIAVRAQGDRFLVATSEGEGSAIDAWVFEAGTGSDGPVAHVAVLYGEDWTYGVSEPEPTAAPVAPDAVEPQPTDAPVAGDLTSDVYVERVPVDLYGRTLVWLSTDATIKIGTLPVLPSDETAMTTGGSPKVGKPLAVTVSGFLPGEEVAVWLQSAPVLLGAGVVGADGRVALSVTIPAGTAPGAHTVTVVGVESGWRVAGAVTVLAAGNTGLRVDTGL